MGAERFALACKAQGVGGPVSIGQPWNVIAFVKRLGGIAPKEADWINPDKYNKTCSKALNDMDKWYEDEPDARIVKLGAAHCGNPIVVKYLVSTYGAITINTRGGIHAEMIYGYGNDNDGQGDYYLLKNSYAAMWRHERKKNKKTGEMTRNGAFNKVYLDSDYGRKRLLFKSGGGYCGFAECAKMTRNPHDECPKKEIEGMLKDNAELDEGINELNGVVLKKQKKETKCVKHFQKLNPTWKLKKVKDECKRLDWPTFPVYVEQNVKMVAWCGKSSCRCPSAYKAKNESCCKYFENRLVKPTEE